MGATLSLSETRLDVVPGGAAVVVATLVNTGPVVDELRVEVLGAAGAWAVAEPPALSLFPASSGTVALSFLVPDGSSVSPGPVPFDVRLTCREDPSATVVAAGVLVVAGFSEASILLSPQVARGTTRALAEVVLENKGNAPVELALSGQADGAAVRLEPASVVVEPGELALATATVVPDRPFLRGPERLLVYSVTAGSDEHPELVATGQMAQSARLPGWALPVGLVVLALVVLVPLAALGARAQVRSTARAVARQEVAKANPATLDPTAAPTDGTPAGDGSGAGVSIGPAAPGSAGGRAIDGRIALTASGQAFFEVPAGKTLRVTDIVLQNPAANTGTLRIRRNDQVLLEVGLENFRTQDLHFVTPLSFTSGQRLVLDGACSGPCSPSALFSAMLLG